MSPPRYSFYNIDDEDLEDIPNYPSENSSTTMEIEGAFTEEFVPRAPEPSNLLTFSALGESIGKRTWSIFLVKLELKKDSYLVLDRILFFLEWNHFSFQLFIAQMDYGNLDEDDGDEPLVEEVEIPKLSFEDDESQNGNRYKGKGKGKGKKGGK